MRAHYKRSKHQIGVDWFRLWLSPVFETATCADVPAGEDPRDWSRQWISPATPVVANTAIELCKTCPALMECRVLVSLVTPRSVVQAGRAYGIRTTSKRRRVSSASTPADYDEDEAC